MSKKEKLPDFSKEELVSLYYQTVRIRMVEEAISDLNKQGKILCPTHLCIGQEAIAVGVCANLRNDDFVFSNHRNHGHYLAKGGNLKRMMAEILGKETGCSLGRGGSMHLIDPEVNFMGCSAIVGGNISIATGAARKFKLANENGRLSVVFFGDAASEEGEFYESLNFAALENLPVMFICENNFYSVRTHISKRQANCGNIFYKGHEITVPGYKLCGNNVVDLYQKFRFIFNFQRIQSGPVLIECETYRLHGHVEHYADLLQGRDEEEYNSWLNRCPIKKLESDLLKMELISLDEISEIRNKIFLEIQEAVKFAEKS